MAGISNSQQQVHVAELYAPFSNTEFRSIEAAGLAFPDQSRAASSNPSPSFTRRSRACPRRPYAFGYVMLDKADTGLGGFFRGVDLANAEAAAEKLKVGARVTTKFAQERIGDVLDFWYELDPA